MRADRCRAVSRSVSSNSVRNWSPTLRRWLRWDLHPPNSPIWPPGPNAFQAHPDLQGRGFRVGGTKQNPNVLYESHVGRTVTNPTTEARRRLAALERRLREIQEEVGRLECERI